MKRMKVMFIAVSLVLAPFTAIVNAKSSSAAPPPIEQPLVAEGEFAVELANALKLTSSHDEAAAESGLASIDILPRNGWISDYPMTPDILAEVRESAAKSASLGNLHISGAYAADVVDTVSIAMNLPIYAGSGSDSAAPPSGTPEYLDPSVVDEYFSDNEAPVVTYYPPPWEYADLYEWVPWPFWWGGFDFGGFFILADFDRHHHHHHHHITNHVMTANGTVTRVNATTRAGTATATHHTGSTTNTANTATQRNLTSPGSARDADKMTRNPGSATRDTDRSSSTTRVPTIDFSSPSYSGRSFSSSPPAHSFTGGGSGSSFHGGGGSMGGFHGGGGGMGGFHGGGGGGHR